MAAQQINQALIAKLGLDQSEFNAGMRSAPNIAKKAGQGITRAFKVATAAIVATAAATVATVVALGKMAQRGQQIINVQTAFNRATGDGVGSLRLLKDATADLVSEYELMVQTNTALTLGSAANVEQFAELAKTAQQLGRALGVDAAFALNSLNIGIARQSKLILDNLGIMVSVEEANTKYAASIDKTVGQLTDVQKKEAFRTEALLQANEALGRLGETGATAGDMWVKFTTTIEDIRDQVSKLVAESSTLKTFFAELGSFAEDMLKVLKADAETMRRAFEEVGTIAGAAFMAGSLKAGLMDLGERGIVGKITGFLTAPILDAIRAQADAAVAEMMAAAARLESIVANIPKPPPVPKPLVPELGEIQAINQELMTLERTFVSLGVLPKLDLKLPDIKEINALGDAIRDHAVSAVVDLATEFKNVLDIVKNLTQAILTELVNALARAAIAGDSIGSVFRDASTFGLIGAGIGLVSQFFHEGGIVQPPRFAAAGGGNVPAMLQAGEVVLSRATVGRLGGPAAADQLNQGASGQGGGVPFVFDASRLPAASNPLAAARDGDWVAFLSDSIAAWEENGGSLRG